jgi:hypothetical protein
MQNNIHIFDKIKNDPELYVEPKTENTIYIHINLNLNCLILFELSVINNRYILYLRSSTHNFSMITNNNERKDAFIRLNKFILDNYPYKYFYSSDDIIDYIKRTFNLATEELHDLEYMEVLFENSDPPFENI